MFSSTGVRTKPTHHLSHYEPGKGFSKTKTKLPTLKKFFHVVEVRETQLPTKVVWQFSRPGDF